MSNKMQFKAGGTIRPSRFIKAGAADHTVLEADAGELAIGVSMDGSQDAPAFANNSNAAESGEYFRHYSHGDECLVEAGGTVTRFTLCASDADGKAVTAITGDYACFLPYESASSGELVRGMFLVSTVVLP